MGRHAIVNDGKSIFVPNGRISVYKSSIELDELKQVFFLDLQRDTNKFYFVLLDQKFGITQEISMFLKQAQNVLLYCQNDFRRFVAEMLCVKHEKVTLRQINNVIKKLIRENLA